MKKVLAILLFIIIGLLAYIAFKPKEVIAPVEQMPSGQTTTINNPTGTDYFPEQATTAPKSTAVKKEDSKVTFYKSIVNKNPYASIQECTTTAGMQYWVYDGQPEGSTVIYSPELTAVATCSNGMRVTGNNSTSIPAMCTDTTRKCTVVYSQNYGSTNPPIDIYNLK